MTLEARAAGGFFWGGKLRNHEVWHADLGFVLSYVEEELRKLREETNVDSLRQELERERSKRIDLEQKMNEVVKSR